MIKMILDNILVKPEKDSGELKMSAGGIYMARPDETSVVKPFIGTVVDVGPGAWFFGQFIEPTVKVGDRVQYKPNTGYPIEHDYEEYVCLKEADIMAVLS